MIFDPLNDVGCITDIIFTVGLALKDIHEMAHGISIQVFIDSSFNFSG